MSRKTTLTLTLDNVEVTKLDEIAAQKHVSRSELVNTAIGKFVNAPELIGQIAKAMLSRQAPEVKNRKKPVGLLVSPEYIDQLDRIGLHLITSRNALGNLIVGGINEGAI